MNDQLLLKIPLYFLILILTTPINAKEIGAIITQVQSERNDQFVISFNKDIQRIVADDIPITINPPLQCFWAWMDDKNLACELTTYSNDEILTPTQLKPATKYNIKIKKGLLDSDNKKVRPQRFNFTYLRPALKSFHIDDWLTPTLPVLQLKFNQYLDLNSIKGKMSLISNNQTIPLELYQHNKYDTLIEEEFYVLPSTPLTPHSQYTLQLSQGIRAESGLETSVKFISHDTVISENLEYKFIEYKCINEYNNKFYSGPCYSDDTIALSFTSYINRKSVQDCLPIEKKDSAINFYRIKQKHQSILSLKNYQEPIPHNIESLITNCLEQSTDRNSRKLTNPHALKSIKLSHKRPKLKLNLPNNTFLADSDKIDLYVDSINNDYFYLNIDTINHEKVGYSSKININHTTPDKSIRTTLDLPVPESKIISISGKIFLENPKEKESDNIPFNIVKSPYQIKLKHNLKSLFVQITDIKSAEIIPNLDIMVSIANNTYHATTNDSGIAKININTTIASSADAFIETTHGTDTIKIPVPYDFSIDIEPAEEIGYAHLIEEGHYVILGITDKPIYRPGETVKYKLYIRQKNDTNYVIPDNLPAVKIFVGGSYPNYCYDDNHCNSFYVQEFNSLNKFGALSGEFTLPKTLTNNNYYLDAVINTQTLKKEEDFVIFVDTLVSFLNDGDSLVYFDSELNFQVSNFKSSDYKLILSTKKKYVNGQEKVPLKAQASYYSGGYVANEKGQISGTIMEKYITRDYPQYQDYLFYKSNYDDDWFKALRNLKYDNQGMLSANYKPAESDVLYGSIKINAGLKVSGNEWNYSNSIVLPYRQKDFFVGIKPNSWFFESNKDITFKNILIDYKGIKHTPSSSQYYIYKKDDDNWDKKKPIKCNHISTDKCQFSVNDRGHYEFTVISTIDNQEYQQGYSFHVFNNDGINTKNEDLEFPEIVIQSDKDNYKIGDKAKFSILLPFSDLKVLVTTERNSVLDSWYLTSKNNRVDFELTIQEKHAPGFSVSAMIQPIDSITQNDYFIDIEQTAKKIKVHHKDTEKLFSIASNKSIYQPKEHVSLTLSNLSDNEHEYTVAVIDQSILDLIDSDKYYKEPLDLLTLSKQTWELLNSFQTGLLNESDSKSILFHPSEPVPFKDFPGLMETLSRITVVGGKLSGTVMPQSNKTNSKDLLPPHELKQGLSNLTFNNSDINLKNLRYYFAESAFFKTDIRVTGKQTTDIDIPLPDNITEWRIIVMATDESGRIKIQQLPIKSSKDLELRSTLPLQLTEGDKFVAQYSVVSKIQDSVGISAKIKSIQNTKTSQVQQQFKDVKKLQSKTFNMSIDAKDNKSLGILATVQTKHNADGLFQNIPIATASTILSQTQWGQFVGTSQSIEFKKPRHLYKNEASLSINLSNSLLSNLQPIYDYMENYPHACWEQQSAKAIITAIELQTSSGLNDDDIKQKTELVNNILNNAQDFQSSDGGLSFFGNDDRNVSIFLSLYTIQNFNLLKEFGFNIPKHVEKRLLDFTKLIINETNYLDNNIYRHKNNQLSIEILLMTLNLNSEVFENKHIADIKHQSIKNIKTMSLFSLNQMLVLFRDNNIKIQLILDEIKNRFYENDKKFVIKPHTNLPWYLMASETRNQCELISNLALMPPQLIRQDDILKHIYGVLDYRNSSGEFQNTLENTYCTKALFDYSRKYEKSSNNPKYQLMLQNKTFDIVDDQLIKKVDFSDDINIELSNDSNQQSYYSATLKYPIKANKVKAINNGFNLQRKYYIFQKGKWKLSNNFKVGDWVKTILTVHSPISRHFVAVSNPVPGGWLPTDTELANNMPVGIRESEKNSDNSSYFYERQLNPAITKFYADFLPAGTHQISYYSQIRSPGVFIAKPAMVEEMYDDQNRATTKSVKTMISANN